MKRELSRFMEQPPEQTLSIKIKSIRKKKMDGESKKAVEAIRQLPTKITR